MNKQTSAELQRDKPQDHFEQVFWHIDRINLRRSYHYSPESLVSYVRELVESVEPLYNEWLRAQRLQKDGKEPVDYLYLVLPYISFRLLNARGIKPVNIFRVTSAQKRRFIDCMIEELHELSDSPLLRALMKESLNTLIRFLDGLQCRRVH